MKKFQNKNIYDPSSRSKSSTNNRPEVKILQSKFSASVHMSLVSMAGGRDCSFELLDQPPYSPDFDPSDYHLFPNMKKKKQNT